MFVQALCDWINTLAPDIHVSLQTPPKPQFGDYCFNCYELAKKQNTSPQKTAQDLAGTKPPFDWIASLSANGPFLNITLTPDAKAKYFVQMIEENGGFFGHDKCNHGKALIEHTSTNPNAPPHLGRARNALLGDSIRRLLSCSGYEVETHFFVNDIGKQIALLVLASKDHERISFDDLLELYISINERMKTDPNIEKDALQLLARLEQGEKKIIRQFRQVVDVCIKGQKHLLEEFGITFDAFDYESEYIFSDRTKEVLNDLRKTKKLFRDKDNREVLDVSGYDLPMKNPVFVLTRQDGTSLYGLRDIAYTIDKIRACQEKNILVLGEDQKLYFKQIAAALDILGHQPPECIHYSFVLLETGKMSTRKGNVVLLKDFMTTAYQKAQDEISKRNFVTDSIDTTAKQIGYGAIKFALLRVSMDKNVLFRWEDALSFEGESGPCIQYTHARICSLLQKTFFPSQIRPDYTQLTHQHEHILLRKMIDYELAFHKATTERKPHLICQALYGLSKSFNELYQNCSIKDAKTPELGVARLRLANVTRILLRSGLFLLGIEAPERM